MRIFFFLFLFYFGRLAISDPLPVKEAFQPTVSQTQVGNHYQTTVTINFPTGYYLYAEKTTLTGGEGKEQRSPSKSKNDPYLGQVKIWDTPPTLTIDHTAPLQDLTLKTQGCQEGVICYPPTTWQLSVPPIKKAATGKSLFTKKNDLLDEQAAFQVEAERLNDEIKVQVTMPDGYYLYRKSFAATWNGEKITLNLPIGEKHEDDFLGEQEIYRHFLTFSLSPPPASHENQLTIHFQGCAEGRICYPPMKRDFLFPTASLTTSTPSSSNITSQLNQHFFFALPVLLLLGIGVSFTACIYPLVPIVTSLVIGKNTTTGRAYRLITTYVLAMGGAMALLGAVFGIFEINLQLIFQKWWITTLVALLFVALSLSLFDVYTFQAPSWLQNPVDKLARKQQSGSYLGAAVMGALSVLVVSPCATPVLTALLLFTTQTTPLKGAFALFVFGLGTGLPLFLFAGALRHFMPKAGGWMDHVKKGFAFALLAVAVYLLTRILPLAIGLAVWALYALFFAIYWLQGSDKKRLFLSGVAGLFAIALAVESANLFFSPSLTSRENLSHGSFQTITNENALITALSNSEKPVIVDFYADWCISCQKWEKEIWQNPQFTSLLGDYTLLKIDVTDFNADHKMIFQRLGLVGPPAVLFYPPHGKIDHPAEKIIGELPPEEFSRLLTERLRK